MEKKLTFINKRAEESESKKDWIGDVLHGNESGFKTKKQELNRDKYTIYELKKMIDRATEMKREARLDFEAQICELKGALKKYKDELPRKHLRKDEAKGTCVNLRYRLD